MYYNWEPARRSGSIFRRILGVFFVFFLVFSVFFTFFWIEGLVWGCFWLKTSIFSRFFWFFWKFNHGFRGFSRITKFATEDTEKQNLKLFNREFTLMDAKFFYRKNGFKLLLSIGFVLLDGSGIIGG